MITQKIDICMTATIRPNILERTLSSFCSKMLGDKNRFRLIINIDPVGENLKAKFELKVAQKYFDDIVCISPKYPSFTKAVIWCWSQVTSDYVFHLEDDWELLFPVNIDSMIKILNDNPKIVSLRLNKDKSRKNVTGYTSCPKISLNPILFKGEFIKNIWKLMDVNSNPEKQLRSNKTPRGTYISLWRNAIYTEPSIRPLVKDIGRDWMNHSQYTKKTGFMYWTKK